MNIQEIINNVSDQKERRALQTMFSKVLNDAGTALLQGGTEITASGAELNQSDGIGGPALAGEAAGERVEKSRQTFANAGTAAADVIVAVVFATAFAAAPIVSLGAETALGAYISIAATTTGVSVTVPSVPAATTVYVNVIVAG